MTSLARKSFVAGVLALAFAPGSVAVAQGTPGEVTPAVEEVCTGIRGAAFGLCIAYCEANDCDLYPDSRGWHVLRENYTKITGDYSFPCEFGEER